MKAGTLFAVKDFDASVEFYANRSGFEVVVRFDDPPYASRNVGGYRLSKAEYGHPLEDLSDVVLSAPSNPN